MCTDRTAAAGGIVSAAAHRIEYEELVGVTYIGGVYLDEYHRVPFGAQSACLQVLVCDLTCVLLSTFCREHRHFARVRTHRPQMADPS